MTALRQQAFEMLGEVPEESLFEVIQYLQTKNFAKLQKVKRVEEKRIALEELLNFCKFIPDLDYKKELAEYREEKFGDARFN